MGGPPPARTLVVLCPDWPVTALGGAPDSLMAAVESGRIFAASAAARRLGVRPGQRRREAQSRCPELLVVARDEAAERRAFEPVVRSLEAFGPAVAVGRPGWAGLGTRGPARYFGGEEAFALRVAEVLGELLGTLASREGAGEGAFVTPRWQLGIADGPFAATIAAEGGHLVPSAMTAAFLAPLPVEALEQAELAGLLRRLGLFTLGEFAALEERDVLARFGVEGASLQALARGEGGAPLSPRRLSAPLVAELTPETPIGRVDEAAFAVRTLAADLAHQLSVGGLSCALLEIAVVLSDGRQVVRRWSHDGPFAPSLVAERLRFQLEVFLLGHPREGEEGVGEGMQGIVHLRLEALEIGADLGRSFELWGRPGWSEEEVARAFARLQGLAGAAAVLRPVLVGGRGPGERVHLVPFGEAPPPAAPREAPWPGALPAPSPTLIEQGCLLTVTDAAGAAVAVSARGVVSAPPAEVALAAGAPVAVSAWGGPWPADERWWEGARHRRRARIQVLLADGQAWLLSLERGRWYLEGRYD